MSDTPGAEELRNRDQVQKLIAAVDEALAAGQATSYRDTTPLPAVGPTPPVAQPGQPPMSQWATDASGVIKAVAVASLPVGGALWLVGQVDPLALGLICGSPVALALAVGRLVSHIKATVEAAPAQHHHHYADNATIDQRSINTTTRGIVSRTRNEIG